MRIAAEAAGASYIRTVPWVRWSMPNLTGDRPAQGFEHLTVFYGSNSGKKQWSGSGALTHFAEDEILPVAFGHKALRGENKHGAEKPIDQCLDLVSWFSFEGQSVLDLCAGRGSMGRACDMLGRKYVGFEIDAKEISKATERLASPLSAGERERVKRWLQSDVQVSEPDSPNAKARAERRKEDKERVRRWLVGRSS